MSEDLLLNDCDFAEGEACMRAALGRLFDDWILKLKGSESPDIRELSDWLTRDGFYPFYTKQPIRLLFVGRDAYGMDGRDYISVLNEVYRRSKMIGDSKSLNQHLFHSRMLYIAWGLIKGGRDWGQIPWAEEIGDDFGTAAGISFAFMNLCKVRRDEDGVNADFALMDEFCAESIEPRNFIAEQVAILKPDVVITMNLGERCRALGEIEPLESDPDVTVGKLDSGGWTSLHLDCWHFSATNKAHVKNFYQPICDAIERHRRD